MIVYFDTSALVPLFIDEPTSAACERIWNASERVVCGRLVYPEAAAALGRAARAARLTSTGLVRATAALDDLVGDIDMVEVTAGLATSAGQLAQFHGLRGYDAVHLAAALTMADDSIVMVTGDVDLAAAAGEAGLATALVTAT